MLRSVLFIAAGFLGTRFLLMNGNAIHGSSGQWMGLERINE